MNPKIPSQNYDFLDYDETCQHTKLHYDSGADSLLLIKPDGIEVVPAFLPAVSESLTVEEVDRAMSAWNACRHVTSERLMPDMVAKLLSLLPDIANYLECCVETNRHEPDDSVHLLEALQPFL